MRSFSKLAPLRLLPDKKIEEAKALKKKIKIEQILKTVRQVTQGKDGRLLCPHSKCSMKFTQNGNLLRHYKTQHLAVLPPGQAFQQQAKPSFTCQVPSRKLNSIEDKSDYSAKELHLLKSVRTVTARKDGRLHCPYNNCTFSCGFSRSLLTHYEVEHLGKRYPCAKCDFMYKNRGARNSHQFTCNGSNDSQEKDDGESQTNTKVDKGKDLSSLDAVKHVTLGKDDRFHCPHGNCNQSFRKKSNLFVHYRSAHLGIQYRCRNCKDSKFDHKHQLKKHLDTCNGSGGDPHYWAEKTKSIKEVKARKDGRFHCPFKNCTRSYTLNSHLIRHTLMEHYGRRFPCSKCQYLFKRKTEKVTHETKCTGNCLINSDSSNYALKVKYLSCLKKT